MQRTECPYEKELKKQGYIQIYDGQTASQKAGDQVNLKPEERMFFIRYYQLVINNRPTNNYVKLVYDLRTGYLRHFPEHYRKLANGKRQVKDMLALHTIKT